MSQWPSITVLRPQSCAHQRWHRQYFVKIEVSSISSKQNNSKLSNAARRFFDFIMSISDTWKMCLNKTLHRYVWLTNSYVFINYLSRSASVYFVRDRPAWKKLTVNGVDRLGDRGAGQSRKSWERRHVRKMILNIWNMGPIRNLKKTQPQCWHIWCTC